MYTFVYIQGQASDIAIHAEEFIKLKSLLNTLLAQHTGQSLDTIGEINLTVIADVLWWGEGASVDTP